jgi:U4/U6.U5 tri-snRNP component SNU23
LEGRIGKQVVINKTSTSADTGGYYCDICDCVIKDSINFLDHINGKNHQRNMGFSMKVKRSTVDDIREKLASKKDESKHLHRNNDSPLSEEREKRAKPDDLEEDLKEEEAKLADLKRQKKSNKKKAPVEEEQPDPNDDLYKVMGLAGFGGSKKNN